MTDEEFGMVAVMTSLKHMFESSHFSICDVDKCAKVLGVVPNRQKYEMLSLFHCIHWSEMSVDVRQEVFARTLEMLADKSTIMKFDMDTAASIFGDKINRKTLKLLQQEVQ